MAKILLSEAQFQKISMLLIDLDERLSPEYSGRGMYGASCLSYSVDRGVGPADFQMALAEVLAPQLLGLSENDEVGLAEVKEAMAELGPPSSDGMGLGSVYYYRGIQVEGHEREARF